MAKQSGLMRIRGSLGNVTFVQSKDGYHARMKPEGVSKESLKKGVQYQRTRENTSEFGRASSTACQLRRAMEAGILHCRDSRMVNRLNNQFRKVLNTDSGNDRGQRTAMGGDISLLRGFSFNQGAAINDILRMGFTSAIDHRSGQLSIHIPEFVPKKGLVAPKGATHAVIHSMGGAFNFDDKTSLVRYFETEPIKLDNNTHADIEIIQQLPPGSANPMVLLLGIRFYDYVNGKYYLLYGLEHNTAGIIQSSKP